MTLGASAGVWLEAGSPLDGLAQGATRPGPWQPARPWLSGPVSSDRPGRNSVSASKQLREHRDTAARMPCPLQLERVVSSPLVSEGGRTGGIQTPLSRQR